ncbi:MAG: hypothetical protein GX567_05795 [Clostridia bacterium]|nr:hypothetical protein [Clostridia bacterium]
MGALVGSILYLYFISLIISMFAALFRFLLDVKKWHDIEEPVHITPSQFEADLMSSEDDGKEVDPDGERSEHNSPIVF